MWRALPRMWGTVRTSTWWVLVVRRRGTFLSCCDAVLVPSFAQEEVKLSEGPVLSRWLGVGHGWPATWVRASPRPCT